MSRCVACRQRAHDQLAVWHLVHWFMLTALAAWIWLVAVGPLGAQTTDRAAESTEASGEKETSSDVTLRGDSATDSTASVVEFDFKALEQQLKETLRKVTPAVVAVSGGSGVVVSEDGYVLTVAHVGTRAGRRVRVTFPDGRQVWGTTLGNDRGVDAGLIKLSGNGPYPFVTMGVSGDLEDGQWCIAMGYPVSFERGKPPAVRIGRVLSSRDTTVVTDCTIMGGDSGGPLFDMDGNVVGISSRCDNRLTVNIHVPVDCYHDTWDRLAGSEDFNSLSRGIAYLGVGPAEGRDAAEIGEVFPDSGAAKAGIQPGDVLLKFDGQDVSRYSQLPPLILKRKPGDEVEIVLRRGDKELTLKARLSDRDW